MTPHRLQLSKLITAIPFLLILSLLALSVAQAQQPTFRVGVLAEANSQLGRGARLIIRQLNQAGGVQGADGTVFRLEPVFAPVTTPEDIPAAVEQIAQANVIAVVGPQTSEQASALLPSLATLNLPVLTPATEDSLIVEDTTDLMFRVRASRFFTERALANYLVSDLGITTVSVYQLDVDATVSVLGFTSAYQEAGGAAGAPIVANTPELIQSAAAEVAANNPPAIITYGDPQRAGEFYIQLRSTGYAGQFAHPQASSAAFRGSFPPEVFFSTLSATTWSPGATDAVSSNFISSYARTFAEVPNEVAAASADAVLLLAAAISLPGELRANLLTLEGVTGVQGTLSPATLNPGETSNNVFVTQLNEFGAPDVVARFAGDARIELTAPVGVLDSPQTIATPLPDGVFVTVTSSIQNVRSGPSTNFDVIGQLNQGDQLEVVGANSDFSWLVIDFRGRDGWIANLSNLNEIIGDLNTVPVADSPPTPIPPPQPTQPIIVEAQEPDIVIQAASVDPNPIRIGQQFTISVTVGNQGNTDASNFSVAVTLPPDDLFLSANLTGLGAGQSTTVNLSGTINDEGSYSAIIVADLNNTVAEGDGENNNRTFNFSYSVQGLSDEGTITLNDDQELEFEDGFAIRWDDPDIEGEDGTRVGILSGTSFGNVQEDQVNSSSANQDSVEPDEEDIIAILGSDGERAIARVQDIDDNRITLRYKVFD